MDKDDYYITCNPIRLLELALCLTIIGFAIYYVLRNERMHLLMLIVLWGTVAAFTYLTYTDNIITIWGRRAGWNIWVPISLMASLLFFLNGSLLFIQTRRKDWLMYVVGAVICIVTGIIFLIDYMGCLYYIDVGFDVEQPRCADDNDDDFIGEMPLLLQSENLLQSSAPPLTDYSPNKRRTVGTQFTCEIIRKKKKCDCPRKRRSVKFRDKSPKIPPGGDTGGRSPRTSALSLRSGIEVRRQLSSTEPPRRRSVSAEGKRTRKCLNCGRTLSKNSFYCNCSDEFMDDTFEMFSRTTLPKRKDLNFNLSMAESPDVPLPGQVI